LSQPRGVVGGRVPFRVGQGCKGVSSGSIVGDGVHGTSVFLGIEITWEETHKTYGGPNGGALEEGGKQNIKKSSIFLGVTLPHFYKVGKGT